MTHMKSRERTPLAIWVDRSTEFLNDPLKDWCQEHGIDLEPTAPYSPSQNGVAERMNRTLVELTRAMIRGRRSPEFLWEYAAEHAAYLRNRAYTRSLEGKTPYEAWHGNKPNVEHLREFGTPVWVLLQGQKEPCKILPKSKSHTFVGFDDGPKAIKYYSAETRKVLTSRNFSFIDPPSNDPPSEEIVVAPDVPREGESRGSAQPSCTKTPKGNEPKDGVPSNGNEPGITCASSKRKQPEGDENILDVDIPRKTRGKRIDYRHLNDPFSDEEDGDELVELALLAASAETQNGNDKPKSLTEAKKSSDGPSGNMQFRTS